MDSTLDLRNRLRGRSKQDENSYASGKAEDHRTVLKEKPTASRDSKSELENDQRNKSQPSNAIKSKDKTNEIKQNADIKIDDHCEKKKESVGDMDDEMAMVLDFEPEDLDVDSPIKKPRGENDSSKTQLKIPEPKAQVKKPEVAKPDESTDKLATPSGGKREKLIWKVDKSKIKSLESCTENGGCVSSESSEDVSEPKVKNSYFGPQPPENLNDMDRYAHCSLLHFL